MATNSTLKEGYGTLGDYLTKNKKKDKFGTVMGEFKDGTLKSSSGQKVTNPKQAQAIAYSESRRKKKK